MDFLPDVKSIPPVLSVLSILNKTLGVFSSTRCGIMLKGETASAVPMTIRRSTGASASGLTHSLNLAGNASPKNTMSGLIGPLHSTALHLSTLSSMINFCTSAESAGS